MGRSCRRRSYLSGFRIRILSLQAKLVDLSQQETTTEPMRKRCDFNQALSTLNRLHREAGRTTTQSHAQLEVQTMAIVVEFFLHLVAMERILVVFLRIQRKSMKEDYDRSNGATCCWQIFGENSLFMRLFFKLWARLNSLFSGAFPYLWPWKSSLLDYVLWNWKKVQCVINDASVGCTFFQEMPACAIDDAFTPEWYAFFALRLRVRLEQFNQLYVAHVLNHFLCRRTERVVSFVWWRSRWRDCRRGWFSIFLTSSRIRELSAGFTTECGNPSMLKSNVHLVQHWMLVTLRVTGVTANNGRLRSIMIWVWICLAWFGTFGLLNNLSIWSLSNFWTLIFHPVMCQGNLWRRARWPIYFLAYDFSSFHPNNFRDTISWECFMKNDSVRIVFDRTSILSSEQSWCRPHTPYFWCFFHALYMYDAWRGSFKSIVSGSLWFLSMGSTGRKNTVCLLLKFWPPVSIPNWRWNVNWLHIQHDKCPGRSRSE